MNAFLAEAEGLKIELQCCRRNLQQKLHIGRGMGKVIKGKRNEVSDKNTDQLRATLIETWDKLDIQFSNLAERLNQAWASVDANTKNDIENLQEQLRKSGFVITRQPGPVMEYSADHPARDLVQLRLLGGHALWQQYLNVKPVMCLLSESTAQACKYNGKSDVSPIPNHLLRNTEIGKVTMTFCGQEMEHPCVQQPIAECEITCKKGTPKQTYLKAEFPMSIRRIIRGPETNEDQNQVFDVPLRHYYCMIKMKDYMVFSLPLLIDTNGKKQESRSGGGRHLTETVIFGASQLPPAPVLSDVWKGGRSEEISQKILDARREWDKRRAVFVAIPEVVSFLAYKFPLVSNTARGLNKYQLSHLENRLRRLADSNECINWGQFSKLAVPSRSDVKKPFSIGTWFWGIMEILEEDQYLRTLWERGYLLGLSDSDKVLAKLSRDKSMAVKFSDSQPPGCLVVSYRSGGMQVGVRLLGC